MLNLNEKITLVTGGASGIGKATALALADAGAKVAIVDIAFEGAERVAADIRRKGGEALAMSSDVSQARHVDAMMNRIMETWGRLDCAVNNAGVGGNMQMTAETSEDEFDRITGINLKGVWLCMRAEICQFLKQGGGVIVNTASVAGRVGFPGSAVYTAAKHGVLGLTKAIAMEYARSNIRINAVCPGFIRTPLLEASAVKNPQLVETLAATEPMGRIGEPEEVAGAILFLCSEEASFCTGSELVVDGGYIAP